MPSKKQLRKKVEERRKKREAQPDSDPNYNHSDRFHDWEPEENFVKVEE